MVDDPEASSSDEERSASDIADLARASDAGSEDGEAGTYDPDDKLGSDTPEQVEAYDRSYGNADKN